jgi:hypothetical protein
MAELAEYFKDNDGTLTTAGTSTVYTVTNNGSFTSLADGLDLSITIDETCGASPTLNVNGLGAKKFRKFTPAGEVDLAAGDLVANGHYSIEYDSAANGGSGAWIVLNPTPQIPAGSVINSAYAEYTTNANLTTLTPHDDTIPQVGEGTQILSVTITPSTTTNKVYIRGQMSGTCDSSGAALTMAVHVNGGADAIYSDYAIITTANHEEKIAYEFEHLPASTSAQTYTVRVGPNTGIARLNGLSTARRYGGTMRSTIIAEERKA